MSGCFYLDEDGLRLAVGLGLPRRLLRAIAATAQQRAAVEQLQGLYRDAEH